MGSKAEKHIKSRIIGIFMKPPRESFTRGLFPIRGDSPADAKLSNIYFWTAAELARHMEEPPGTVYSALRRLCDMGHLAKHGKHYSLTQKGALHGAAACWCSDGYKRLRRAGMRNRAQEVNISMILGLFPGGMFDQ